MSSQFSSQPLPSADQPYETQPGFSEAALAFEETPEAGSEVAYSASAEETLQHERTYRKSARVVGQLVIGGLVAALVALSVGASLYVSRYTGPDDAVPNGTQQPNANPSDSGIDGSSAVPMPPAIEPDSAVPAQTPATSSVQPAQPAQPTESAAPAELQAPAQAEPQAMPAPAAN